MAKKFKSEALESIHGSASALLKSGAIDKATKEFDETCIAEVPAEIKAAQIREIRQRSHVSQPVFAK